MRRLTADELKRLYKDAWWSGVHVDIEHFINSHLSESEKRELRKHLEAWETAQRRLIREVELETDWEKLWNEKILPYIRAPKFRLSIWQRIRRLFQPKKKAYADQVQQTLEGCIIDLLMTGPIYADFPKDPDEYLYNLPDIEGPNMKISIFVSRSEPNATQGVLDLYFQPQDSDYVSDLEGIRLRLCNLDSKPIRPKKQARILRGRATFPDVDLTMQYTIHVS